VTVSKTEEVWVQTINSIGVPRVPNPWNSAVREHGRLSVYNNLGSGLWSSLFDPAISEINRILGAGGLSISFEVAGSESSANVVVAAGNGRVSFSQGGQSFELAFDGTRLHGKTQMAIGGDGTIQRAFVFVPSTPQLRLPSGPRLTGRNVMTAILIHEFVHCCGLRDAEHSNNDIFVGYPDSHIGDSPDQDMIGFMGHTGPVWFPPYFLSPGTITQIQANW